MKIVDRRIARSRIRRIAARANELAAGAVRRFTLAAGSPDAELARRREDVTDSATVRRTAPPVYWTPAPAMTVGWICAPPDPESDRHATLFRMIEALENVGHTCVLYLYDPHGVDLRSEERRVGKECLL